MTGLAAQTAAAIKDEVEVYDTIGHVMMSYQWADQTVVKQIRDSLRSQVTIYHPFPCSPQYNAQGV